MKSNHPLLDHDRFYEITEVRKGDTWYEPPGSEYCIVGAIVQPTDNAEQFMVIQATPGGYLTGTIGDKLYLGVNGSLTLRPLNKKDQEKLQRKRDQFCA